MIGNKILLESHPQGRFEEVIVVGTPKPGQWMGRKPATAPVGGNPSTVGTFSMEPAGATAAAGSRGMDADGDRLAVAILLGPGETASTPPTSAPADYTFTTGERGMVYWPQNGDRLNTLFQNAAGTADDVAIGDKLIIDDGTGKVLVSTGTPLSEPLEAIEALTDPTADTLIAAVWCGQ